MDQPSALVVDSDPSAREPVIDALRARGLTPLAAATAAEALELLRTRSVRVAVVDLEAPGVATTALVSAARRLRPAAALVAVAEEGHTHSAIAALDQGAVDVLYKPLSGAELDTLAGKALVLASLLEERERLKEELRGKAGYRRMIGRSLVMERLRDRLERLAGIDSPVMFVGDRGTGKELAARSLHAMSSLAELPLTAVDCGALGEAALESELFRNRDTAAGGSVLYLDGVLDLKPAAQQRMAELLDDARMAAYPRVLSSATGDVERAVDEGRLLEALGTRLAHAVVHVPPLRERMEDIPLLARHFVERIREVNDLPPIQLTAESLELLERYGWPGNVRELRNAVEQAVTLAVDGVVRVRDFPSRLQQAAAGTSAPVVPLANHRVFKEAKQQVVDAFEKTYLEDVLERNRGNVTAAAQQSGMLRSALQRLLRKHSIRSVEFRRR